MRQEDFDVMQFRCKHHLQEQRNTERDTRMRYLSFRDGRSDTWVKQVPAEERNRLLGRVPIQRTTEAASAPVGLTARSPSRSTYRAAPPHGFDLLAEIS